MTPNRQEDGGGAAGVTAAPAPRYLTAEECHELAETVGLGSVTVQRKFCEVNGLPQPVVRSAGMGEREPTEAELVCYEAYQVVGSLLSDLGKFDTPEAEKILDNLSQAKLVHKDVLPWESYAPTGVPPSLNDQPKGGA